MVNSVVDDSNIPPEAAKIADEIIRLAKDMDSCQKDLPKIVKRGWLKNFLNNTDKELAEAMLKQGKTISFFLEIIRKLIFLYTSDVIMLGAIQAELSKQEKARGATAIQLINIAKEFICDSLSITQKYHERIKGIKGDLDEHKKLDEQQSRLIEELIKKYDEKNKRDEWQDGKIVELEELLKTNIDEDGKRDEAINEVKEQLGRKRSIDDKQSAAIKNINTYLVKMVAIEKQQSGRIKESSEELLEFKSQINKNTSLAFKVAVFALIIAFASLILSALRFFHLL